MAFDTIDTVVGLFQPDTVRYLSNAISNT